MATKKQKRAAALAKREEFLAKVQTQGLATQKASQAFREKQDKSYQDAAVQANAQMEYQLKCRIVDGASGFGRAIANCELSGLVMSRRYMMDEWAEFLHGLTGSPYRKDAISAWEVAYSSIHKEGQAKIE